MHLPDVEVNAMLAARYPGGPTRWLGLLDTVPTLAADGSGYVDVSEIITLPRVQVDPADWKTGDRYAEAQVIVPDLVDDHGVAVAWAMFLSQTGGVPTVAGKPNEAMDLVAGTSDITVVCRVVAPESITA